MSYYSAIRSYIMIHVLSLILKFSLVSSIWKHSLNFKIKLMYLLVVNAYFSKCIGECMSTMYWPNIRGVDNPVLLHLMDGLVGSRRLGNK